jgi:hypothetical protein
MPFREVSAVDQRRELAGSGRRRGRTFASCADVSESVRRPHTSGLERHRWAGLAGLVDRSLRPEASPLRTPAAIEAKVIELRERSNNVWGGRKIKRALEDRGEADIPAASTITEILRRHNRLNGSSAAEHPGP